VPEALDAQRDRLDCALIDYADLILLDARTKIGRLLVDARAARAAAPRLATMVRERRIPVDVEAADAVKHRGLIVR
jgi:hypothetical protein